MSIEIAEFEAIATSNDDVSVDLETLVSSSNDNVMEDLGVVCNTMLTRLDLSIACFSEKVSNLRNFVMHLATMEGEFETLVSEKNQMMGFGSIEKGLEFDLLCGVLDSVVRELDEFLNTLHVGIVEARKKVCSCNYLVEIFITLQDKLLDYEESLKQSEEEFNEIKLHSASFQWTLCSFCKTENGNAEANEIIKERYKSLNVNADIKLQTIEQQRYILTMLEKSLAKEMDLEKNLCDSREIQEKMNLRMSSLEQELVHAEEETIDVWERWFEADNAREILMGISKNLLSRLQISHFNLNGLTQRESEIRAKLDTFVEQSKTRDTVMNKIESNTDELNNSLLGQTDGAEANSKEAEDKRIPSDSEIFALRDKVSLLEKQLKDSEIQLLNVKSSCVEYQNRYNVACSEVTNKEKHIVELKETVCNAESRADIVEAKCNLLMETNSKLNDELNLLKGDVAMSMKVDLLEKQLKEINLQLHNSEASVEASKKKESMLYSTIRDMENAIKDHKSKVSKAESRADSAEENCIILSESNDELNEELNFLRIGFKSMEESLHREKEAKITTAKDIRMRTKVCKELIKQMVIERERLKEQLSSLASENKILVVKLKQTHKEV
ncbi:WPP domain-interacting tail-anchored protein 1-like [Trifolium pratense]|uniref:WPP domain-interacting tail-anchored protein 1-like n=1 Tax=Trifolium pratense TaxID=57577 RepID=UPI001E694ADD|nr:WPP domain-interacting tail-anchored protein 1-like [Trifolium pratense]XP_045816288.1 WPP domain-interacting tail-anchored protein 1-like [Trifolium pratense]XP_045816289.1 WPP domain-interacting tail-anchored protein 1-like [Trifolium pratense]